MDQNIVKGGEKKESSSLSKITLWKSKFMLSLFRMIKMLKNKLKIIFAQEWI